MAGATSLPSLFYRQGYKVEVWGWGLGAESRLSLGSQVEKKQSLDLNPSLCFQTYNQPVFSKMHWNTTVAEEASDLFVYLKPELCGCPQS